MRTADKRLRSVGCIILPAALGAAFVAACLGGSPVDAQTSAPAAPVRLAEIASQDIFLPLYGALGKGFFQREGLTVEHKVTLGPARTLAALIDGDADIALGGPDMAVLSALMAGGESIKVIAAISRFEGSFLVGREKIPPDRFRWDTIKGKSLMGWRTGTYPSLFVETALRNNGIDPHRHIDYRPDVPYPARMQVWRDKQVDYAVFYLTDAARLERDGAGYPLASIGEAAGPSVYAVFLATATYIDRRPDVIQKWANAIQSALTWTASAPLDDLVATAGKYVERAAPEDLATAYGRYRKLAMWQTDPTVSGDAIAKVQTMMIASAVMPRDKRMAYETVVEPRFAENARRAVGK